MTYVDGFVVPVRPKKRKPIWRWRNGRRRCGWKITRASITRRAIRPTTFKVGKRNLVPRRVKA